MFWKYLRAVVIILCSVGVCHVEGSTRWGRNLDKDGKRSEIASEDEARGPNLLVSKRLSTEVFAVGWEIVVEYEIFNVGKDRAFNIKLEDEDFTKVNSRFDVMAGSAVIEVEGLAGGGGAVQFNVTVVPNDLMNTGSFVFSPAKVTYGVDSNEFEETITGFSSIFPNHNGRTLFISREDADRKFKPKTAEYCIFFLMCVVPVGVPFSLWMQNRRKYNKLHTMSQLLRARKKMKKMK